ncbi:type II secretion system F family protein [Sphingopyxis solisilvae]|uniref:type II secretion system F family protein n=1 Tax=Sphingopyxis solisilvae TaxID=1886788 RepID=UPI001892A494|nr:type II secretion system F family protein [Sphingopyxis solisilvae]
MNDSILRLLTMVALFAFVVLVVQLVGGAIADRRSKSRAVNERLRLIEAGVDREIVTNRLRKDLPSDIPGAPAWVSSAVRAFHRNLVAADIRRSVFDVMGFMAIATLVVTMGVIFLISTSGTALTLGVVQLALAFGIVIGVLLPWMVIGRKADARRRRMEAQFPVALDVFVRGLRAGHPIPAAMNLLVEEMEDPVGTEFGIVSDEIAFGFSLRDALQRLADRWGLPDIDMFVVSVSVQMETGGNLAEILENLGRVIRERASMFMKVRALSSEGRMTAVVLTALPILSFAGLFALRPEFYLEVAGDPIFTMGFAGLLLLYAVGFFWIRRMVDLKV